MTSRRTEKLKTRKNIKQVKVDKNAAPAKYPQKYPSPWDQIKEAWKNLWGI